VTTRIIAGSTERIQTPVVKDGSLAALTGLSTVVLAIQRVSDGFWYDFNDDTFKASGWTTRQATMSEVSSSLAPGEYYYDWDTSAIVSPTADDTYMIRIDETGGTAKNTPFVDELKVDQWVKDLFDEHSATQSDVSDVQADTDDIQTRLPAALVSGRMDSDVGAMQAGVVSAAAIATDAVDADALAADAVAEIQSGLATASQLTDVETDTQDIQSRLPAALVGGRMDSDVGAMQAGVVSASVVGADAIDADALASDAVSEIQSGLATASQLTDVEADTQDIQSRLPAALVGGRMDSDVGAMQTDSVDADALAADAVAEIQSGLSTSAEVAAVQADTDDIQTRLPATLSGGRMRSHVEAIDNGAITAGAIATDAVDADALASDAVAEIQSGLATAAAVAAVQADTDDIQTRLPTSLVGGRMDSDVGAMQAGVVDAAAIAAGAVDADALASDAVDEIADGVWDETIADHLGVGSTGEALNDASSGAGVDWTSSEREQIRDAIGVDGAKTAATGGQLQGVFADTAAIDARLPADPADESNQIAQHAATQAAIAGLNDLSQAEAQAACVAALVAQGYTSVRAALLDNLDELISSRAVAGDEMALTAAQVVAVVDAVWDEAISGHVGAGSTGAALNDAAAGVDPVVVAETILDQSIAAHQDPGTVGRALNSMAAETTVGATPTPTAITFGTSLTEPDDTFKYMTVVVVAAAGWVAARTIEAYAQANGAISVNSDNPFPVAPAEGDTVIVLRRVSGASIEASATMTGTIC